MWVYCTVDLKILDELLVIQNLGIQTGNEIEAMSLAQHSGVQLQDRRVLSSEIYVYPDQNIIYLSYKLCLKIHMQFGFAFEGTPYI